MWDAKRLATQAYWEAKDTSRGMAVRAGLGCMGVGRDIYRGMSSEQLAEIDAPEADLSSWGSTYRDCEVVIGRPENE